MICDSSCFSSSSATLTIISIPVALNALVIPIGCPRALKPNVGTMAINARNSAPNNVIRLFILARYSLVGFPGLTPWIVPPYCCRFLATTIGLNCNCA